MPRSLDRPQVSIRLDAKTFYLLELASRIGDKSVSEVIREALNQYFGTITPVRLETLFEPFDGHDVPTLEKVIERRSKAENELRKRSLLALSDALWFDDEALRLQILAAVYPHLLTDSERQQLK